MLLTSCRQGIQVSVLSNIKVRLPNMIDRFSHNDATGGVIMLFCTVLALILQNGSYSTSYRHWIEMNAGIVFGDFHLIKPLLLWINDGLITIFFFSIGLALKTEFIKGNLSQPRNIILPAIAALGGIIVPSLFFMAFNHGNEFAMRGWAIPTSTDTAFSVALLLLLGNRVPASLKIFLLSMAIFDDIGAIIVIAIFYTSELSLPAIVSSSFAILCLMTLNYFGVARRVLYLFFGLLLWFSILKSGMHATLAGIITAFCIPMKSARGELMVEPIYDSLKMWVALLVLPVFTIANAGIDLSMIDIKAFFAPVSLGIFTGLFFGKQLGIFTTVWLASKLKLVQLPSDATISQMYGVCILTGIGFSMSMFIDSLAYQGSSIFSYADSLAILLASLCSGVVGYCFLRFYACRTKAIEYRPWLPSPSGYKGTARTANLYSLDKSAQGPASVAPTAALVAEANARAAAVAKAAKAADQAAQAAKEAAEAAAKAAQSEEEADDQTIAKVQLAAAQAAAAAATAAVSTAKLDDTEDEDTAEVAAAALEAATQAAEVAAELAAEVAESSKDEESEDDKSEDQEKSESESTSDETKPTKASLEKDEDDKERKEESDEDSDKKEGSILEATTSVASKAIAKVVNSIIADKDNEEGSKSDESKKSDKESKDSKSSKKPVVTALRVDGKEEIAEIEDNGPKTVISVNSVGFAKVEPLPEQESSDKDAIEPLMAESIAPEEVAEHERIIKGSSEVEEEQVSSNSKAKSAEDKSSASESSETKSKDAPVTNDETAKAEQDTLSQDDKSPSIKTKSDAQETPSADVSSKSEESQDSEAEDKEEKKSEDKKAEKKDKLKAKMDFDSDIYLNELVGSVAAQVEKLAEEKAKSNKGVTNVAELIAKAKNIDEAIHRASDKSKDSSDKADAEESDKSKEPSEVKTDAPSNALDETGVDGKPSNQEPSASDSETEGSESKGKKGLGILKAVLGKHAKDEEHEDKEGKDSQSDSSTPDASASEPKPESAESSVKTIKVEIEPLMVEEILVPEDPETKEGSKDKEAVATPDPKSPSEPQDQPQAQPEALPEETKAQEQTLVEAKAAPEAESDKGSKGKGLGILKAVLGKHAQDDGSDAKESNAESSSPAPSAQAHESSPEGSESSMTDKVAIEPLTVKEVIEHEAALEPAKAEPEAASQAMAQVKPAAPKADIEPLKLEEVLEHETPKSEESAPVADSVAAKRPVNAAVLDEVQDSSIEPEVSLEEQAPAPREIEHEGGVLKKLSGIIKKRPE